MAARNPTNVTAYVDESLLLPKKPILEAGPDETLNDLEYILDAPHLTFTDMWSMFRGVTSGTFVEEGTWNLYTKDMCDVAGIVSTDGIEHDVWVLAWCSNGSTGGDVKLTSIANVNTTVTIAIPTSTTTPTWFYGGSSKLNLRVNVDIVDIGVKRTAGAGKVFLAGIALIALET